MGLGKERWIGSEENALAVSEYHTDLLEFLHLRWPQFCLFVCGSGKRRQSDNQKGSPNFSFSVKSVRIMNSKIIH